MSQQQQQQQQQRMVFLSVLVLSLATRKSNKVKLIQVKCWPAKQYYRALYVCGDWNGFACNPRDVQKMGTAPHEPLGKATQEQEKRPSRSPMFINSVEFPPFGLLVDTRLLDFYQKRTEYFVFLADWKYSWVTSACYV